MAIFSPLQSDVSPMQAIIPEGQGGAPAASALAGLSELFLSGRPAQVRAPTQNEIYGERVREFGERISKPGWNPAEATMGELRQFGSAYPEFGQEAFAAAKAGVNEELLAYENSLTTQQKIQSDIETAWLTSPEGVYATAKAREAESPEKAAAFVAEQRALWVTTNAENTRIKREVETKGAYEALMKDAWKNSTFSAKTEADIFARGFNELGLALASDPTATFNLDETGITQLIPELRGTVVNQRNIVAVGNIARGALETKFRNDLSANTSIPSNQLGIPPAEWATSVFNTFDTTLKFVEAEVNPDTIQKRLESEAFTDMAQRGVPVQYLSTISRLSAANPTLAAQFMGALSGPVGKYTEELMAGRLEEATRILQESSKQDLVDARYAFTELVAIMSGQSTVARTYEEVEQDQKDLEISSAITGAIQAHIELQRTEGPTRWNRAAWRQNFEVPAEAIARRAATDTTFASTTSQFLSSDIMLDLGNLRDAAAPNGVTISISENGLVVIGSTDQAEPLQGSTMGVARRPLAPADKLNTFIQENKAIIDDINYKMTILNRLGDLGKSTLTILRGEVPSAGTTTTTTTTEVAGTYAIGNSLGIDFAKYEADAGLPAGYLEKTAFIESKGDVTAVSSTGATGLFQFTSGTAKQYGLVDRTDPVQSTEAAVRLALANQRGLRSALGREPTGAELYLAHQQGLGGATALLSNSSANVVDALATAYDGDRNKATQAVEVNGGNVNMTAGEFANIWLSKYSGARGPVTASQATGRPTPVDPSNAIAMANVSAGGGVTLAPPVTQTPTVVPVDTASVALPEAIPAETTADQAPTQQGTAQVIDKDVKAFISEIAGNPDKTYRTDAEFLAAQSRGELEPGDTVIVDNVAYVIRKDGTARRLGTVEE